MCAASTSSTPKILAQLMLVVHINMNNTTNIILYPVFSLSDTLCKSILRNDGKIITKLWLAMGSFQIMLIFFFS
jgi:hypothetical protein